MKKLIVLIAMFLSFAVPAFAQEKPNCSSTAYIEILQSSLVALQDTNSDSLDKQIADLLDQILSKRATCAGLVLSGEHNGVVVGPIDVPTGIYRVKLEGENTSIEATLLGGQCEHLAMYNNAASTEHVFQSQGCRILIEVSGFTDAAWSLSFALVQ